MTPAERDAKRLIAEEVARRERETCRACPLTDIPHGQNGHTLVLFRVGAVARRTTR